MTESETPAEHMSDARAGNRGRARPRTRLPAAERRASILAAAVEVFSEVGYQRGKVSDIARRVGVTEPVVFQNFGSKSALYQAALDHAANAVTTLLVRAAEAGRPVPEVLAVFLDPAHMERFHQPGAHGFLFADAAALAGDPALNEAARRVHRHFAGALADLLHRGQADGDVRADVSPEAGAWWLVSLLAGRGFRAAVVPDAAAVEGWLTELTLRALLTGDHRATGTG